MSADLSIVGIMLAVILIKRIDSIQRPFKNDITTREVISHTKYIDTELVYLTTCGN